MKKLKAKDFSLFLLALFLLPRCSKDVRGCTNEWAANYSEIYSKDCCCRYDTKTILDDLVGRYTVRANCNNGSWTHLISISKADAEEIDIPKDKFAVNVDNLFAEGRSFLVRFDDGDFKVDEFVINEDCRMQYTASFKRLENGIEISYTKIYKSGECGVFAIDIDCLSIAEKF